MNDKVLELAKELETVTDPFEQDFIRILLLNVQGAEMEKPDDAKDPDYVAAAEDPWEVTNRLVNDAITRDPQRSFQMALRLAVLAIEDNGSTEWRKRYLRGTGLAILSDKRILPLLAEQFQSDKPFSQLACYLLITKIRYLFVDLKVSEMSQKEAFATPEFYSFMNALLVVLELGKYPELKYNNMISLFIPEARMILSDLRIVEQIEWYTEIPGTLELATRLLEFVEE